jgi:hypothetical protein
VGVLTGLLLLVLVVSAAFAVRSVVRNVPSARFVIPQLLAIAMNTATAAILGIFTLGSPTVALNPPERPAEQRMGFAATRIGPRNGDPESPHEFAVDEGRRKERFADNLAALMDWSDFEESEEGETKEEDDGRPDGLDPCQPKVQGEPPPWLTSAIKTAQEVPLICGEVVLVTEHQLPSDPILDWSSGA